MVLMSIYGAAIDVVAAAELVVVTVYVGSMAAALHTECGYCYTTMMATACVLFLDLSLLVLCWWPCGTC